MAIDIPFNNDPVSTTVKTGAYSVPAGNFARVKVTEFGANFTIDGSIAIPQLYFAGSASTVTSGTIFTNTSEYTLIGSVVQTGASSINSSPGTNLFGGQSQTGKSGPGTDEFVIPPQGTIAVGTTVSGSASWYLTASTFDVPSEFWVPGGTSLNGDRYIVELYNSIS